MMNKLGWLNISNMGIGQIRRHIGMLIWRETINGMLCYFVVILINDTYCSKPIKMVKLNSYFVMPKCIISKYITQ